MLVITKVWECEDTNCLYCKDASNKYQTCKRGFYRHNGECVSKCPSNSILSGIDCYDCSSSCKTCEGSTSKCTSCNTGYYLYNSKCYSKCPDKTTAIGTNCVDCKSPCYICKDNAEVCTLCIENYFLYDKKCYLKCSELNNEALNIFMEKIFLTMNANYAKMITALIAQMISLIARDAQQHII